jgi:hypothetical protein
LHLSFVALSPCFGGASDFPAVLILSPLLSAMVFYAMYGH